MNVDQLYETILFFNKFKELDRLCLINKNGRRESDAEHTWQLVMTVWLLSSSYEKKMDLNKALKMALIHDLVEIYSGDVYAHSTSVSKEQKKLNEIKAMERMVKELPNDFGQEIKILWEEYEERVTEESKFIWLVDKLMPRIQYKLTQGDPSDEMESDKVHDEEQKRKMREMSPLISKFLDKIYS